MRINLKSIHKFTENLSDRKSLHDIEKDIFNINSERHFIDLALRVFHFQYQNNDVYHRWVNFLKINPDTIKTVEQIPFLPVEFFKTGEIISCPLNSGTVIFNSSSTTSQTPAKHFVNDISLYEKSFLKGFDLIYGQPKDYCILALLPNYLERTNSSLVYMFDKLIKESAHSLSGFFLNNIDDLIKTIEKLKVTRRKVLLIGVSYALMDLSEKIKLTDNFIVMETGGMKGKRKELLKEELHDVLKNGFEVAEIHSEYGMTELLSQAYSRGGGIFQSPPWMRFLIREVTDPLKIRTDNKTGGINVIDLANIYSCSFIATQDLGKLNEKSELELMGRYDNSDVRGCNLMIE